MSTSDPLITHLQQNSNRIARMLTPGKKSSQVSSLGGFSPVAPDFAGRKFQLAAQKMQVLNPKRMGHILPADKAKVGTELKARFEHNERLMHLPTSSVKSASNWSKVEMTVPRGGSSEKQQPSNDPGMMRAGSIIPKMSTFPKTGQTLESFKDQVQRGQAERKPTPAIPKTPRPSPRDRLFTRVQEMTPGSSSGEKETNPDAVALPPTASMPPSAASSASRPTDATPDSSKPPFSASPAVKSTVQRQPDTERSVQPPNHVRQSIGPGPEPVDSIKKQNTRMEPLKAAFPSTKLSTRPASEPARAKARPAPRLAKSEPEPVKMPVARPSKPAQVTTPTVNRRQIRLAQPLKSVQSKPELPDLSNIQQKQQTQKRPEVEPALPSKKAMPSVSAKQVPDQKAESKTEPAIQREQNSLPSKAEPKLAAAEPSRPSKKDADSITAIQNPQRETENTPTLPLAQPVRAKPENAEKAQSPSPDKPVRRPLMPTAQPVRKITPSRAGEPSLPKARLSRPSSPAYEPASPIQKLPLAKPRTVAASSSKSATSSQNIVQRQPDAITNPVRENRGAISKVTPQNRSNKLAPSPEPGKKQPGTVTPPQPGSTLLATSTAPSFENGKVTPTITPQNRSNPAEPGRTEPRTLSPAQPETSLLKAAPVKKQPLQQVFEYRRLAASQIKASPLAARLSSPKSRALIDPAPKPLVSTWKYQATDGISNPEAPVKESPIMSQAQVAQTRTNLGQPPVANSNTGQTVMRQVEAKVISPATPRVTPPMMDLAKVFTRSPITRTAERGQPTAPIQAQPGKPGSPAFGPPPTKITNNAVSLAAGPIAPVSATPPQKVQHLGASSIVQRQPTDETQSGHVDTNIDPPPQKRANPADIEPLAMKLLPYIKHLMEIEAERNGRMFR